MPDSRMRHRVVLARLLCLTFLGASNLLADEPQKNIDIFVSGEGGYLFYRIPAMVVTNQKTILAFCEGRKNNRGDRGNIDLVLRRSEDGGETWKPMQVVHDDGGDAKIVIGNPCPVVDRETGTIWLPFCRNNLDVFMTHSNDDGRTWATPQNITTDVKKPEWGWYATGPGNGIQLAKGKHKGRLVIPCDHRVTAVTDKYESSRSHVIYSDDHGKTWKLGGGTEPKMNECAVAELPDGRLLLNMRSFRGNACRASSTSADGGLAWTAPVDEPVLIESACQASMIFVEIDKRPNDLRQSPGGGKMLIFSNPAVTKGRNHLTMRFSYDGGKNWPDKHLVYERMSAYSSLAHFPNGGIGILFERDTYKRISLQTIYRE